MTVLREIRTSGLYRNLSSSKSLVISITRLQSFPSPSICLLETEPEVNNKLYPEGGNYLDRICHPGAFRSWMFSYYHRDSKGLGKMFWISCCRFKGYLALWSSGIIWPMLDFRSVSDADSEHCHVHRWKILWIRRSIILAINIQVHITSGSIYSFKNSTSITLSC